MNRQRAKDALIGLKNKKFWKIMIVVIGVIAVLAAAAYVICAGLERKTLRENQAMSEEAKKAGANAEFYVCTYQKEVRLNGRDYEEYKAHRDGFIDGGYSVSFLIPKGEPYLDETKGRRDGLIVYGTHMGYENDPEDPVTYDPGKYEVIDPLKIAIYKEPLDMWAVVGLEVLVALIEIALVCITGIACIVSFVREYRRIGI